MEEYGFVDTLLLRSRAYRVLQPAAMTDLYASVPSLLVGWNLVMGIALVRESSHAVVRAFGMVMPPVMAALVLTANHYLLDVVIGVALVVASLRTADWLADRGGLPRREERRPALPPSRRATPSTLGG
jgi:hypothetical protein